MENLDNQAIGGIGGLVIELFARQAALLSLLREQPGFTEEAYQKALQQARKGLNQNHVVATFRSQATPHKLEELDRVLRGL